MNDRIADAVEKAKNEVAKVICTELVQQMLSSGVQVSGTLEEMLKRSINVQIVVTRT